MAGPDLLVESLQILTRPSSNRRANEFQGLPIHFIVAKTPGQSPYPRFHIRRIGSQAMEKGDFMFDAHNNQGWVSIPQEHVYVAIDLAIKMSQVIFRVIAIMHGLRPERRF